MRRTILTAAVLATALGAIVGGATSAQDNVTLRVLIHQNPPFVDYMNAFNEEIGRAHV